MTLGEIAQFIFLIEGRLRAGWRLLLFVFFFLLLMLMIHADPVPALVATLASTTLATWFMMRVFEHQPFQAVGLAQPCKSLGEMALGMAGGITLVGTVTVVEWTVGVIRFQPSGAGTISVLEDLSVATGILVVAAGYEELLFRGYPFQRLVEGTNAYVAVAISSLLFGVMHAANPHATILSIGTLNTMLAGILLSIAYLKSQALWLPLSFHFAWNWSLALAGLPVSGIDVIQMPWQAVPSSEYIWLHGGDYGPEGGLLGTAVLAAGTVYLLRKNLRSASRNNHADAGGVSVKV